MASYLQKRRRRWYAILEIPATLRPGFGKSRFVQSLETDSRTVAVRRVLPVVTAWKKRIAAARDEPVDDDAAYWQRRLQNARSEEQRQSILEQIEYAAWDIGAIKVENIGDTPSSDPEVQRFHAKGTGHLVDITEHLDERLSTSRATDKTQDMQRSDVKRFAHEFHPMQDGTRPEVRRWEGKVMNRISDRVNQMAQSAAILVDQKVRKLTLAGRDIVGLGSGEPDFDTPNNIKQAAIDAMWAGKTKYTAVDGIAELKAAIVQKFERDNGLSFKTSQISVGAGGKQIISNAFAATLNPGDQVIIPAPYWVTYPDSAKVWGGEPVVIACSQSQGFKMTPEQLDAAITDRTSWVIINSPSNPTGATYDSAELRALADVLIKHRHVNIMTDDIYEHIVFDDRPFATIGNVAPELADRILIVNGVSKTYCMTGWRIGYGAGPEDIIRAMAKVQGQTTTHPSSISQHATVEALNGDQKPIEDHVAAYQRRRDFVVAELNEANGIDCRTPEGAFYVYPSCAGVIGRIGPNGSVIATDEDFALTLLESEGVAIVHGAAFGLSPHFRITTAASDEKLAEACKRIQRFCAALTR